MAFSSKNNSAEPDELERAFRATRAPDDELRWLSDRVATAKLPWVRVELAAGLGHPVARGLLLTRAPDEGVSALAKAVASRLDGSAPIPDDLAQAAAAWLLRVSRDLLPELCDRLLVAGLREPVAGVDLARFEAALATGYDWRRRDARRELRDSVDHGLARGVCWELSDDQADELQREIKAWEKANPTKLKIVERIDDAGRLYDGGKPLEVFLGLCGDAGQERIALEIVPWLIHGEDPLKARK